MSEFCMALEVRHIAEAIAADRTLQAGASTMHAARDNGWRRGGVTASLMHLEVTDSVRRVVALTACKLLLYLVSLKMSAQMTQLHCLVTASDNQHRPV